MSLTLPRATGAYDARGEQTVRGLIEAADRDNLKRGRDLDLLDASANTFADARALSDLRYGSDPGSRGQRRLDRGRPR